MSPRIVASVPAAWDLRWTLTAPWATATSAFSCGSQHMWVSTSPLAHLKSLCDRRQVNPSALPPSVHSQNKRLNFTVRQGAELAAASVNLLDVSVQRPCGDCLCIHAEPRQFLSCSRVCYRDHVYLHSLAGQFHGIAISVTVQNEHYPLPSLSLPWSLATKITSHL